MSRESLKTLFHPFVTEAVALPAAESRWLFLGAEAGFAKPEGFAAELTAVQDFRPEFRRLEASHLKPLPAVEGNEYDGALVLCGKHKGVNEDRVAEALKRVKAGGTVLVAGAKEDGILPLRKQLDRLGLSPESMPKYHGVVVWFTVPEDTSALVSTLAAKTVTVEGRFETRSGLFSHAHADEGSELLATRLPADFNGNAAEFGAGWGYLSVMLADAAPRTNRIDLFEGHAAEPSIGAAMIKAAAEALRGGGDLLMVANRGLPYEPILGAHFKQHGEVCRNARFKVLWAKR